MRRVLAIPIAAVVVTLFSVTITHAQTEPKDKPAPGLTKVVSDSGHLVRLALKAKNGAFDTTHIKLIRIVPANLGATGKGKRGQVTTDDSGPKKIIFTRENNTVDTVILKKLESVQLIAQPLKIVLKANSGADSNKVNVIDIKPAEIVGKPAKGSGKQ